MITDLYTKEQKQAFLEKKGYSKAVVKVWSTDRFDDIVDEGTREIYFKNEEIKDSYHLFETYSMNLDAIFKYEFAQSLLNLL